MPNSDVEAALRIWSTKLSETCVSLAATAQSEEDIRHGVNGVLDGFVADVGLQVTGRHEYGVSGGRIDSKYAGVVIEYKSPRGAGRVGPDATSSGAAALIEQIKRRFVDLESAEGVAKNRILGVGTDAKRIVFVRYRDGKFGVDGPEGITSLTAERVLRALVSLGAHGRPFTPEELARAFGSESPIAAACVQALYSEVRSTRNPRTHTLFEQWQLLFGEVSGYDETLGESAARDLARAFGLRANANTAAALFAVHTYYALLMKLLAAEIARGLGPLGLSIVRKLVSAASYTALMDGLRNLEDGGVWAALGLRNFLEGDLFSWYLDAQEEAVATSIRDLVHAMDEFDPTTLGVDPSANRDLLKHLYHALLPRTTRHALGEYYTPDWLAEQVIEASGYSGNPDTRCLDPACGSGTFLVLIIRKIREWFDRHRHECGYGEAGLLQRIEQNVVGFDLNPLAVMAARTNYLLAIRDLLPFAGSVDLPVYLADAIAKPTDHSAGLGTFRYRVLKSAVGDFKVAKEIGASLPDVGRYTGLLEHAVAHDYTPEQFVALCDAKGVQTEHRGLHVNLYRQIHELAREGRNGVWARIIRNSFVPVFLEPFDYVLGNPPWINWESLPEHYRTSTQPIWESYGLFTLEGMAARLGGGKKDLAMLFTHLCANDYLRDEGTLGFVITQTVFKSVGAGDGFRSFGWQREDGARFIWPREVHDYSSFQPFEDATNRTAILIARRVTSRGEYPVPYHVWQKEGRGRLAGDATLAEAKTELNSYELAAAPIRNDDLSSPWLTLPASVLKAVRQVIGRAAYEAHEGANTGGLNGCYYVTILKRFPDGMVLVSNDAPSRGTDVPDVTDRIEGTLVYPLLRGRDIQPFQAAPSGDILVPQDPETRTGIPEEALQVSEPATYGYLSRFRGELEARRSGVVRTLMDKGSFYSMFGVGTYTFAEWKVVWQEQPGRGRFKVGVVGPVEGRPVVPNHKCMLVACADEDEADYVCGLLNSSLAQAAIIGYVLDTSASTHVLENVAIPSYDKSDRRHRQVVEAAAKARQAGAGQEADYDALDAAAAAIWGATQAEATACREYVNGARPESG